MGEGVRVYVGGMKGVRERVGDKVMEAVAVDVRVDVDVLVTNVGVKLKVGESGESVMLGVEACEEVAVAVG